MARIVDGWRVEAAELALRRGPIVGPGLEGDLAAPDAFDDAELDDVEAQDYGFSPPEALESAADQSG